MQIDPNEYASRVSEEFRAYIGWMQELKDKAPDKFVESAARLIMSRDRQIDKLNNILDKEQPEG